jgi:hypothetical protein
MIITAENYDAEMQKFFKLKREICTIPNVFSSKSFSVKNKLIKFNELNKALKDYDKRANQKKNA